MSPFAWSMLVWLGVWFGFFALAETLAVYDVVPWNSLSWTIWQLQSRWSGFSILTAAVMAILSLHFLLRWPSKSRWQPPQDDEH